MPLEHLPRSTLVDTVIVRFEELIGSGEWAVGARVPPEPELVRALGVSRNTVREAVRALVHAGQLDPRPGDGTYVRAGTGLDAALERQARRWGAMEALEVRSMLERDAARLAADRRHQGDLEAIDAALARRSQAEDAGGTDEFVDADLAFHRAVVAATHNQVLVSLYGQLTASLRQSVVEVLRLPDQQQTNSHRALARAIRRGDAAAAERAATTHLAESLSALADADEHPPADDRGR